MGHREGMRGLRQRLAEDGPYWFMGALGIAFAAAAGFILVSGSVRNARIESVVRPVPTATVVSGTDVPAHTVLVTTGKMLLPVRVPEAWTVTLAVKGTDGKYYEFDESVGEGTWKSLHRGQAVGNPDYVPAGGKP